MSRIVRTDHLVVGSGVAGLSYALKVADSGSVLVVTKKEAIESNTNYAQGGIAAVLAPTDSFESHVMDTLKAGAGLCDEATVRSVVVDGPARIRELVSLGVSFSLDEDAPGALSLGREGGHSARRIAHSADITGRELKRALLAAVSNHPSIRILDHHRAFELVRCSDTDRCLGALVRDDRSGESFGIAARRTFLATGGAACVYRYTTNPPVTTGDGLAMAYRAGARIANMEFVQFHPTALCVPGKAPFLISEALRGEGAVLRNIAGEKFMERHDARAELAPRDIVARAIHAEMTERQESHVWLDITHGDSEALVRRFPGIHAECMANGIDIRVEPIPVTPAAHYTCGGIWTDDAGRTDIPGLLAAGEVTCTGLHGANRLASNSLLEAVVYAHRAAEAASERPLGCDEEPCEEEMGRALRAAFASSTVQPQRSAELRTKITNMMWAHVAIVRSRAGLERTRDSLVKMGDEVHGRSGDVHPENGELVAMWTVAGLIVTSALARAESRGLHCIVDHPGLASHARNTALVRGQSGAAEICEDPWGESC